MTFRLYSAIAAICLLTTGCGGCGGSHSHLPKPRAPDDDPTEVTAPAAPATSEAVQTGPASEIAANPVAAPPPADPPVDDTAATQNASASVPETEQRRLAIDRLTEIGRALAAYHKDKSNFPERSGFFGRLSWRVVLLPYLGKNDLLRMFETDLPWDHADNRRLLGQIPDVFRATGRSVGKTNIVLVVGPGTAYATEYGPRLDNFLDGPENSILAIEVDESYAVSWTAADDYVFDRQTVHQALFGRHKDCCYALFADGQVRRIPADISDENLLALLTPDGGEPVAAAEVTLPPTAEVDEALIARLDQSPIRRFAPAETVTATGPTPGGEPTAAPADPASAGGQDEPKSLSATRPSIEPAVSAADPRWPVPADQELQAAADLFKDIYGGQYAQAVRPEQKRAFADMMLGQAEQLQADPAGMYVLLRAARDVAAQSGAVDTAFRAIQRMATTFQVDAFPQERQALEQAVATAQDPAGLRRLHQQALRLGDQALARDDFAAAGQLYDLALSVAQRGDDRAGQAAVAKKRADLKQAQTAYRRISDQLHVLLNQTADPKANAAIGRYLCLIKRQWERGLDMLARGDDPALRSLAETERRSPETPDEQTALADRWWDWSQTVSDGLEREAARQRAARWYRQALPNLAGSLLKVRVEQRIAEAGPGDADGGLAVAEQRQE